MHNLCVVDAHKGKIRIESEEGKGNSFILEIPFAEAATPAPDVRGDYQQEL